MTEALQRQLANDEPKCANCKHWHPIDARGRLPQAGMCLLIRQVLTEELKDPFPAAMAVTTDLTVCSKWEKRHAQTEAEQAQ